MNCYFPESSSSQALLQQDKGKRFENRGKQAQIRSKEELFNQESGETLTEGAQRCGRCLLPGNIQAQVRQGSEPPELLEDVPARCGAPGPEELERSRPSPSRRGFCLLCVWNAARLETVGGGPTRKPLRGAAACPAALGTPCSSSWAAQRRSSSGSRLHSSSPAAEPTGAGAPAAAAPVLPDPSATCRYSKLSALPASFTPTRAHIHPGASAPAPGALSSLPQVLLTAHFAMPAKTLKPWGCHSHCNIQMISP